LTEIFVQACYFLPGNGLMIVHKINMLNIYISLNQQLNHEKINPPYLIVVAVTTIIGAGPI